MHHKPILNPLLPFRVIDSAGLGEAEAPQQPAEDHAHLHQRQVLAGTDRRTVREGHESGRVVFSSGCAIDEPSFG